MFLANLLADETRTLITDLLFIPVPGALIILSIIIALRFRGSGKHGNAWIIFTIFAISWFTAEQIWLVYELIYEIDPWPSVADFFYLSGYPLLFAFSILYLLPVRKAISKKLVISSLLITGALLIPTFTLAYQTNSSENDFEVALAASYPVLDALLLCPALIGVTLFFKGKVNFLWSLICLAMVLNVTADTGFLMLSMNDSYYTGHPIDLLYLWAYLLFAFGVYSHIRIFHSRIDEPYENASELR
jgi:hypothetical protein